MIPSLQPVKEVRAVGVEIQAEQAKLTSFDELTRGYLPPNPNSRVWRVASQTRQAGVQRNQITQETQQNPSRSRR